MSLKILNNVISPHNIIKHNTSDKWWSNSKQNTEDLHKFPVGEEMLDEAICPSFLSDSKTLIYELNVEMLCPDLLSAGHFSGQSGALARSCHSTFIQSQLQAKQHYFSLWLTENRVYRDLYSSIIMDKLKE